MTFFRMTVYSFFREEQNKSCLVVLVFGMHTGVVSAFYAAALPTAVIWVNSTSTCSVCKCYHQTLEQHCSELSKEHDDDGPTGILSGCLEVEALSLLILSNRLLFVYKQQLCMPSLCLLPSVLNRTVQCV